MKSLLLLLVLCRALCSARSLLPNAEQVAEKDNQLLEKIFSNTVNKRGRFRYDFHHERKYTLIPDFASWDKDVTYRIFKYPKNMTAAETDQIFKNTFDLLSGYTCYNFTQSWNESDIKISFETGDHSDSDCPFDGEGGVLAHAFSENEYTAIMHFDDDEKWTNQRDDSSGIYLPAVALHELCHVLGLDHSNHSESLMFKSYNGKYSLHQDDIDGLQAIYGRPGNCSHRPRHLPPPRVSPPEEESPDLCARNLTFDAAFILTERIVLFHDRYYFGVTPENRTHIELLIGSVWPLLRCGMDAAYEAKGVIHFFTDVRYWTVNITSGGLSSKSFNTLGLPETVEHIDAAVHDKETKKTLFFSGDEYWRYDEERKSLEKDNPKKIADDFPVIGSHVDAAFQYNGTLYLLRGQNQYEFDPTTYRLIDIKKTNTWFGCQG